MLVNLNIMGLAVVDKLDLELDPGMSVLTGETGAGKSILLTALGLALGDRADSGYVRPHCKRAEINIEFELSDAPLAAEWLQENDLDENGQCLIRRTVSDDGRSKAYINNRPVNLQTLQNFSRMLVEIHGQHAHLTLLDGDEQRLLLDNFAQNGPLLKDLNSCYESWRQTHKSLQHLIKTSHEKAEREEMLRYQLEELKQLDLKNYNVQSLAEAHRKQANLDKILGIGQQQLDMLYDNDRQSVTEILGQCIRNLTDLAQYAEELHEIGKLLEDAEIQISEAVQRLRRFLENQDADPQLFAWLESQIGTIQNLCRKHKIQPEDLLKLADRFTAELTMLQHSNERADTLQTECRQLLAEYRTLAAKLSTNRHRYAGELQKRISATLKELGMPHGEFIININSSEQDEPQRHGNDTIEFLVSTNPGLPPKPLAKIASGGELSRISLAIQVITTTEKTTPTMIFDEVDAGIGGGIAEIVGQKLRHLGKNRQILCVTHLPQVAAQAHHHLFVAKKQNVEVTSSSVMRLANEERIKEVARMLGGVNITENTLAHAQEMLEMAAGQH